jgi:hypothetical protein
VALLLLGACGGARSEFGTDGVPTDIKASPGGATGPTARGAAPSIDADTSITLQRSACFGVCPSYSLSIEGDGVVSYIGASFVKVRGAASSQISSSAVQGLVDDMWSAGYFDLDEPSPCSSTWSDAPSVITSLTLGERKHRVEHYHGNPCTPEVLTTIEDQIDEIAGSERWLRCDTPSGYCPSGD